MQRRRCYGGWQPTVKRAGVRNTGIGALAGAVCLLVTTCCPALGAGTPTHQMASLIAARLAPEPFASNWEKCRYAVHPDYMRDQPLGHENARVAGLLYTLEAIDCLRQGQTNKAMMLASARSHYISDSACIAHAEVWRPRQEDDVMQPGEPGARVWSFLPERYQDYWLPFGELVAERHYYPLVVETPAYRAEDWGRTRDRGLDRSMHGFFDGLSRSVAEADGFPLETVPRADGWSAYDRELYARWVAEGVALEVLDRESVLTADGSVRFTSSEGFQAALDDEMRNMAAAVLAYYRYLTVAASTELAGDLQGVFPSSDPLLLMARREPRIHLDEDAPWPLRRAAHLLAMEIVRASYRGRGLEGREYAERLLEECQAMIVAADMPPGEGDRRIIISWGEAGGLVDAAASTTADGNVITCVPGATREGYILLRGEDLQSTIHLVDYLLDLTHAPLHGRTPVDVLLRVFEREWPGTALIAKLRQTPDAEIYTPELERPPCPHEDDMAEWTDKVHWMIWPNTAGDSNLSGPLPVQWNLLLLALPLPDGSLLELAADGEEAVD